MRNTAYAATLYLQNLMVKLWSIPNDGVHSALSMETSMLYVLINTIPYLAVYGLQLQEWDCPKR